MATPKLPFLYPNLLRSIRACEPTTYRSLRRPSSRNSPKKAGFHSTRRGDQETYQQRYGPAAEPRLPPPPKPKDGSAAALPKAAPKEKEAAPPKTEDSSSETKAAAEPKKDVDPNSEHVSDLKPPPPQDVPFQSPVRDASEFHPPEQTPDGTQKEAPPTPLDTVLQMPPPPSSEENADAHKPPHLAPPPYVHHFDTYSLVRDLAKGGFTQDQSITIMKAIRSLLAHNLDIAKDGLISKSDVENETYLFRAACSELRTSLQTSRNSEMQRQRTQRAHLHHEVDILTQRMTQDSLGLREDLKAMFNERKMASQEEKRLVDGKILELGYEITVLLNSESKSEVEGLRWILTRRAALTIAISACKSTHANYCPQWRDLNSRADAPCSHDSRSLKLFILQRIPWSQGKGNETSTAGSVGTRNHNNRGVTPHCAIEGARDANGSWLWTECEL